MVRFRILFFICMLMLVCSTSCKKCSKCTYYVLGLPGSEAEYCDQELEDIESLDYDVTRQSGWKCH